MPLLIIFIILEAPSWLASLITKRAYSHKVMREMATCAINCNVLMTQPVNTQQNIFNKLFFIYKSGPKDFCLPTICSDLNVGQFTLFCKSRGRPGFVLQSSSSKLQKLQSYKKSTQSDGKLIDTTGPSALLLA